MTTHRGARSIPGKKVGIVVSRWNELVTEELLRGCLDELGASGAPEVVVAKVAGSWEIPLAVQKMIQTQGVEGVCALGCIMQGATHHAEMLAGDVASTLMSLQMSTGIPISWGVLVPSSQEQALERSGMKVGHKGREAASALVEQISLLDSLS